MRILAIDTTGFSAAISIVENGTEVLFNKTGSGYLPTKSWREFIQLLPKKHLEFLLKNINNKNINLDKIDAIAVSSKSGIYNCVLVGLSFAKLLGKIYKKPVVEVDHILAHNYSSWIERKPEDFNFPILVFSASGSHSDFALIKNIKSFESLCGSVETKKIAGIKTFIGVGKIFRAVGKSLGVVKPSRDDVDGIKNAIKIMEQGDPCKYNFKKYYKGDLTDLNFFNFLKQIKLFIEVEKRKTGRISRSFARDVAASFQESLNEILSEKIVLLAKKKKAKEVHLVGGLSQNKDLYKKIKNKIRGEIILRKPTKKEYRLDNAAMIGCLAYYQNKYKIKFKNFEPNITL